MIAPDSTFVEFVSLYIGVILSVTIALAVLYGVVILRRLANVMAKNAELNVALKEREFASQYDKDRLNLERKIADINIQLMSSSKRFDEVNHLIIDGQKRLSGFSSEAINPDRFLKGLSVRSDNLKIDKNLVFVLTPFHPSEERTYSAIVEGLSGFGVRVVRGDETSIDGDILSHIIEEIVRSRIVIANVTTRNPNVMYELGIAHALGKDVVMVSNSKSEVPFDIKSRRILFYSDHHDLVQKLQSELARKVFAEL